MKKTILTISLLVLITGFSTAVAQHEGHPHKKEVRAELTPEQHAQKKTDRMTKSLELDKKQQKEIYNINLKHAHEQAKLRAERKALHTKFEAERNTHSKNIDHTLTESQKEKRKELKAKKAEHREMRKHPTPPAPPAPPTNK